VIYRCNVDFLSSSCTGEFSVMPLATANLLYRLSKYHNTGTSPKSIKAKPRKSLTQSSSHIKNKKVALQKDGAAPWNGSMADIG
jgi:hypothetical protein